MALKLILAGLEPFLSNTEKIIYIIVLQAIFHEYQNLKIKTSWTKKIDFNLIIFHFDIR